MRKILPLLLLIFSCSDSVPQNVESVAKEFASLCPNSAPNDESARDACAKALGSSDVLRSATAETVLWGGHNPEKHSSFDPDTHGLTRFASIVHRKTYLAVFYFSGKYEVHTEGEFTILSLEARFRNRLSPGSYAYPFWHSRDKWAAHQGADTIHAVFRGETIVAYYRAGNNITDDRDPGTFDGQWHWVDAAGEEQPRVALFSYLLSSDNPYLAPLDEKFREMESEFREGGCDACHIPTNPSKMDKLVLLEYPNQTLGDRHKLTEVFNLNSMPPDVGLRDQETLARLKVLAEEFAALGDQALAFEGEWPE